jgi:hypothetical protein
LTERRLAAVALVLGAVLAGCAQSCPAALLDGTLVADGDAELAIKETTGGFVREVTWPAGFSVQRGTDRLVVMDFFGSVIAEEGDRVRLGGGETSSDGPWGVCGQITVDPLGRTDLNG